MGSAVLLVASSCRAQEEPAPVTEAAAPESVEVSTKPILTGIPQVNSLHFNLLWTPYSSDAIINRFKLKDALFKTPKNVRKPVKTK